MNQYTLIQFEIGIALEGWCGCDASVHDQLCPVSGKGHRRFFGKACNRIERQRQICFTHPQFLCAQIVVESRNADVTEHSAIFLGRSEEHTSDLQSLMRISYAVFCLKNTTNTVIHTSRPLQH